MTTSIWSRRLAALSTCAALALTTPDTSHGALTETWSTTVNVIGSGEFDGSPELELIVGNATNIIIIDGATGATEYTFDPSWHPGATPRVWIADTDVDGMDEIVLTLVAAPLTGLFDFDGVTYKERWAESGLVPSTVVASNLTGDAERELVVDPGPLYVLDSFTGQRIYDSDDAILAPVVEFDVTDWDGDGIDDILATFQGSPNIYLISDANPLASPDAVIGAARLGAAPNPSSGPVQMRFEVETSGPVRLRIYDVAGRHVRTLIDGPLEAGMHQRTWDGTDGRGRVMAPGVYYYAVERPGGRTARRMIRLR